MLPQGSTFFFAPNLHLKISNLTDIRNYEKYIKRCFDLAKLGAGKVSPNPMVGAVLVHKNRIIGEGYHEKYGSAHAEVNALRAVKSENKNLGIKPCNT